MAVAVGGVTMTVSVAWDDKVDDVCRSAASGERRGLGATVRASRPLAPSVTASVGALLRPARTADVEVAPTDEPTTFTATTAAVATFWTQRIALAIELGDQRRREVRYLTSKRMAALAWFAWLALFAFTLWWLQPLGAFSMFTGLGVTVVAIAAPRLLAWWKSELAIIGQLTRIWELACVACAVLAVAVYVLPRVVLIEQVDVSKPSEDAQPLLWFQKPAGARVVLGGGTRSLDRYEIGTPPPPPPVSIALPKETGCTGRLLAPSDRTGWSRIAFDHDVVAPTIVVHSDAGVVATLTDVHCDGALALPLYTGADAQIELGGGSIQCNKAGEARVVGARVEPSVTQLVVHSHGPDSGWSTHPPSNDARACVGSGALTVDWDDLKTFQSLTVPSGLAIEAIGEVRLACAAGTVRAFDAKNVDGAVIIFADHERRAIGTSKDRSRVLICDPPNGTVTATVGGATCTLASDALICKVPPRDCIIAGTQTKALIASCAGCSSCKVLGTTGTDGALRTNLDSNHPECKGGTVRQCL